MSTKPHSRRTVCQNYRFGPCEAGIMDKPWFIDLLTYALVVVWMGWTFATMQTHGPGPWLIGSAVIVLAVGLFMVYGQRLSYLQIGDRVFLGMQDGSGDGNHGTSKDWRERNR